MTWQRSAALATVVLVAAVAGGLAAAPATAQEACTFPVNETDATGTEVTLEEEPERIVVTAPSAAQTIWELGEEERVVGMPVGPQQGTDYLEGAEERTHVLEGITVDTEQVVDLEPDLVFAPGVTSGDDVEALRDVGVTVYYEGDTGSLDDVRANVETTGDLLGACEAAEETVDWMDERMATVDDAVADEDRPSTFYWITGGFTAPEGTFQHDLLERAGASNAAAEMELDGFELADEEELVEVDPEYLLLEDGAEVPDTEAVQATTAVQESNVIYVDANHWNQDAPRVVLAVEEIAQQLHPDAFDAAADDAAADDAGETDGVDDDADDSAADDADAADAEEDGAATDADDGMPGFGVAPAVAALLAIAGLLARRD